jgi:hypothetical protein
MFFVEEIVMEKKKSAKIKKSGIEMRVVADKKATKDNWKEFQTNQRLSDYSEEYFGVFDAEPFNMRDEETEAYVLAQQLFKIGGVQYIEIDGYIVRIRLSKALRWSEVEQKIKDCIRQYAYAVRLEVRARTQDGDKK